MYLEPLQVANAAYCSSLALAQQRLIEFAELVEAEQRMVAGAVKVSAVRQSSKMSSAITVNPNTPSNSRYTSSPASIVTLES